MKKVRTTDNDLVTVARLEEPPIDGETCALGLILEDAHTAGFQVAVCDRTAFLSPEQADAVAVALIQATQPAPTHWTLAYAVLSEGALDELSRLSHEARIALGIALIRSAVAP